MIYLVYRWKTDSLENSSDAAYSRECIGFVRNREIAEEIAASAGFYTTEDCWVANYREGKMLPKITFEPVAEIKEIKNEALQGL